MDDESKMQRRQSSQSLTSASYHGETYTPPSRKQSNNLKSRISMFDNKKPSHLPVKDGSPVVSKEKLFSRRASYSPHTSLQRSSTRSSTEDAENLSGFDNPFSSEVGSPRSLKDDHSEPESFKDDASKATTRSMDSTDDGLTPGELKSSRSNSINERLQLFERRSRESLDDNSVNTTSSGGTRKSTLSTGRRRGIKAKEQGGIGGLLSPRHTQARTSGEAKSNDPASCASPGVYRIKIERRGRKKDVENQGNDGDVLSPEEYALRNLKIQESEHSTRNEDFANYESGHKKRSWKPKASSTKPESSLGASEHSSADASMLSVKSFSEEDDVMSKPKKSWKPKKKSSTKTVDSSRDSSNGEEQNKFNAEDDEEIRTPLNDSTEPKIRKKSWKTKRVISVDDNEGDKSLARSSDHSTASSVSDASIDTPLSPQASTAQLKTKKLQDRINLFNKPSTSPTPQKVFLGSHYMNKLVQKDDKNDKSMSGPLDQSMMSISEGMDMSSSGIGALNASVNWDSTVEEQVISVDRAVENEKKRIQKKKTRSFNRRGQLKRMNSALIGQKNKDKNAVFVNVRVNKDDMSVAELPEFAKDASEQKIIKTALRKNFVFEDMDELDMDKLVTAMESVQATMGKNIITQGEAGDFFYVVSKGEVTFYIDNKKIGTAGSGNAFGELALLYKCPRSATVRVTEPQTSLFRVDQRTFTIMMQSETKKSEEEKRALLRKVPFLSSLGAEDITRLCSVMRPVLFSTGDYIVRKGDQGSSFFIIRDGKARVTEIFVGGTSYEDISLEKGDYFGEDALVSDEPRAANVVALTKGSAFTIERESVRKVLGDFGSLLSKTQDRQKLESIKLFRDADLSSADFDNLAKLVTDRAFAAGDIICKRKNETEAALYIVREGSVKITPKDKSAVEVIKAGGAFGQDQILAGEIGADSKIVSKYTAKVLEDCVCGVLTLEDCRTTFDTSALGDRIFSEGNSELEDKRSSMRKIMQSKVKYEDLIKDRIIGEGQFGTVWLVRADPHRTNDESKMFEFALKCQFKEDPVRRDGAVEAIKREMTVIQQLNHPFIIDLVDKYETEDQLMMLTEPVKGGELWSRIHREDEDGNWTSGLPEKDSKFYALVIADVVSFMHRQHIIFRDLKPENVLIDEEGYPTLCDFGFAKYCPDDKSYTFCGTPNYLAPEIVLNRGHGVAVDHWALGVVIYEMITGENPFYYEGQDQMSLLQAIVQEDFYPLPDSTPKALVNLMSGLLEKESVQRLGSLAGGEKGILKHKWFSKLDINQIRNKKAKAPYIPIISS